MAGYDASSVKDGNEALDAIEARRPDLVLLDVTMPRLDGWEVLAELRRRGNTPAIMITALDKDIDRLQGLRIGADDYVVKPFNPIEVVARAKAVLRRSGLAAAAGVLRVGDLAIDLDAYQASFGAGDDTTGWREFYIRVGIASEGVPRCQIQSSSRVINLLEVHTA